MGTTAVTTAPLLALTPQDLATILDELAAFHASFRPLCARREQRDWSRQYLHGVLLELPRTAIAPLVVHLYGADRTAVRGMQQVVRAGVWDDPAILQRLWPDVAADLGDAEAGVLVLDGSDVPKPGSESGGVKRQWCGQLGKPATGQAGMFLASASSRGDALLDRRR